MVLIACPSCAHEGKVPEQMLGKKIKCQLCGMSFQANPPEPSRIELDHATNGAAGPHPEPPDPAPAPAPGAPAREYKVLTQKDKWFDGKFDLTRLEGALNHYAGLGWTVRAMSTPHIMGFSGGPREEIVVLLER